MHAKTKQKNLAPIEVSLQEKMFVASYESSGDEEAVAHAMSAAAHQGTATTNDLVKPVNAIAQAVTAPEGEVPVAEAAAVAARLVPMSHVEGTVGEANMSRRWCGSWGCLLPDFHAGLCTGVNIDSKRKRKLAVVRSEGANAEGDGEKQADGHIRYRRENAPKGVGEQGAGDFAAAHALVCRTTSTAAAMSAGSMEAGSAKQKPCVHRLQHSRCKQCGGASICEHGRQRSRCKECGGASICEHGRQRHRCKECGGSGICEHGRQRSRCKECGGSSICEHCVCLCVMLQ